MVHKDLINPSLVYVVAQFVVPLEVVTSIFKGLGKLIGSQSLFVAPISFDKLIWRSHSWIFPHMKVISRQLDLVSAMQGFN